MCHDVIVYFTNADMHRDSNLILQYKRGWYMCNRLSPLAHTHTHHTTAPPQYNVNSRGYPRNCFCRRSTCLCYFAHGRYIYIELNYAVCRDAARMQLKQYTRHAMLNATQVCICILVYTPTSLYDARCVDPDSTFHWFMSAHTPTLVKTFLWNAPSIF